MSTTLGSDASLRYLSVNSSYYFANYFLLSAIYKDPAGTVLYAKKSSTAFDVLLTLIPPVYFVFGFGPIKIK